MCLIIYHQDYFVSIGFDTKIWHVHLVSLSFRKVFDFWVNVSMSPPLLLDPWTIFNLNSNRNSVPKICYQVGYLVKKGELKFSLWKSINELITWSLANKIGQRIELFTIAWSFYLVYLSQFFCYLFHSYFLCKI